MDFIYFLGYVTFFALIFLVVSLIFTSILLFIFLKTGRSFFPNAMSLLISGLESPLKSILNFLNLDDTIIDKTAIDLKNRLYRPIFSKTSFSERALFLPQCLRSTECPARLDPEGIKCLKCGKCVIKEISDEAERLGYKVFVVPGSSFIRRMLYKYKPKAIIGVGCMPEVKAGLDICYKYKVPGQGIVLKKTGCINTVVDVEELFFVLAQGEVA